MKPISILTPEEITNLIDYCCANHTSAGQLRRSLRNTTMIRLMLEAGLRVGEVVQLKVHDLIDAHSCMDWIRISADYTKTHTERCIPLTDTIKQAINRMAESYWAYYGLGPSHFAFAGSSKTKHITVRQVEHLLGKMSQAAIRRSIYPHVLRHTFATRMMRTTNARVVQELLGHARLSSTQIYTHPNTEDLVRAIQSNSPT